MGMGWTDPGLAREANDYIIESARKYPDRIIGFCSVNPAWGDAAAREIERCVKLGARGIGELHPDTQGFDIGDATTMAPVLEVAQEYGLVITTHSSEPVGHIYAGKGSTTPRKLMRFIENARAYPEREDCLRPLGRRAALLRADAGGEGARWPTSGSTRRPRRFCTRRMCFQRWRRSSGRRRYCLGATFHCCGSGVSDGRRSSRA